ncbi:hypothetical protein [Kitasatospora sp. NPDC058190]|uniref:hypothetical protein n=1 Tax=Kitasatospora sp. NPDC058190 TaxID=3346371 RepID=UPI0036DBCDFD
MTDLHARCAELRLDAALEGLARVFRGATAHPEESNCECHWGSAEQLALLKVPGVKLDPDLLRLTWQAPDWSDHGSVLRRILPQLACAVVDSRSESFKYRDEIGVSLARGRWQEWPREQAAAVWEFLHAIWAHSLVNSDAVDDGGVGAVFGDGGGEAGGVVGDRAHVEVLGGQQQFQP